MAETPCTLKTTSAKVKEGKLLRNNFFSGKKMGVEDFNVEQSYFMDKIRILGAQSMGTGVIEGLKIDGNTSTTITINKGAGIDTAGNVLLLYSQRQFELEESLDIGDYIYLQLLQTGKDKVPQQDGEDCSDICCYNRVQEYVKVIVSSEAPSFRTKEACDSSSTQSTIENMFLEPLLYLGQKKNDGGFDYSKVQNIHRNSELSKRLCEIYSQYVSTVNGQSGDVTVVSSLNGINEDITLEAGNNISIETTDEKIKISSTSSYYHSQEVTISGNHVGKIDHDFGRFPVVDIYKVIRVPLQIDKVEGKMQMEIFTNKNVQPDENTAKASTKKRKKKKARTSTNSNVTLPFGMEKFISAIEEDISIGIENMMDFEKFYYVKKYEKMIGGYDPDINLKVSNGKNSVSIENFSSKSVSLLIVLNA